MVGDRMGSEIEVWMVVGWDVKEWVRRNGVGGVEGDRWWEGGLRVGGVDLEGEVWGEEDRRMEGGWRFVWEGDVLW